MIVLVVHGTRDPAGARVVRELADLVRVNGVRVRVAYADVRGPDVTTVLNSLAEPAVVIPAFLAAGYHVRTDIPAQIAASEHPQVTLAEPFGPAPELIGVLRDRLLGAGYRAGDGVVLAAAGSRDRRALLDVHDAAYALGARLGTPVRVGYAATASPSTTDAVAELRVRCGRVAVASWLLAPGLFHSHVLGSGAEIVADPLGAHPGVGRLVLRRYGDARRLARVA